MTYFIYVNYSASCAVLSIGTCRHYLYLYSGIQRKRKGPAETESMTSTLAVFVKILLKFFIYLILLTLVSYRPLFITSSQSKAFPKTVILLLHGIEGISGL